MPAVRTGLGRIFRQKHTGRHDILIKAPVFRRIYHIHPAAQHAAGKPAEAQRAPHSGRVHAAGHTGDHHAALLGQLISQFFGAAGTVWRALARADNGHRRLFIKQRHGTLAIQQHRRLIDVAQTLGIQCVSHGKDENALAGTIGQDALRRSKRFVLQ